jgi:hypothetical protein
MINSCPLDQGLLLLGIKRSSLSLASNVFVIRPFHTWEYSLNCQLVCTSKMSVYLSISKLSS